MFCKNCGSEINGRYCTKCGYDNQILLGTQENQSTSVNTEKKSNISVRDIIITLTFIFTYLAPIGIILMWVWRIPKSKGLRVFATILFFFLFIATISKLSDIESNAQGKPISTTQEPVIEITTDEMSSTQDVPEQIDETVEIASEEEIETAITEDMTEDEYKEACTEMWYDDIFFSDTSLEGRYVKLDLFVEEGKFFTADAIMAGTIPSVLTDEDVQRNFYMCGVQRKTEYSYIGGQIYMFFSGKYDYSASDMTEGDHLIAYGKIVDYATMTIDGYNSCCFIPKYIENKGQ